MPDLSLGRRRWQGSRPPPRRIDAKDDAGRALLRAQSAPMNVPHHETYPRGMTREESAFEEAAGWRQLIAARRGLPSRWTDN